jgi:hypothetical protein
MTEGTRETLVEDTKEILEKIMPSLLEYVEETAKNLEGTGNALTERETTLLLAALVGAVSIVVPMIEISSDSNMKYTEEAITAAFKMYMKTMRK